jgi:NAD(P)-dependent dehydrogenase (short-subunit alcohol dehydrogenase family)
MTFACINYIKMKQVIVITGTSTGFGTLMAKTFANEGHTVIATMRNVLTSNTEPAKALASIPNIDVVELDVTEEISVKKAISYILEKYKRIDVLINNAAVYGTGLLEAYSLPQVQKLFDVNVIGLLRVNNEVLPSMRKKKNGLIINVSSVTGRVSPPFQAPYNASKFAVEGLIESSYDELIGHGIESVILEPGAFETEIWLKAGVHADKAEIIESYGEETASISKAISASFKKIISDFNPDPQAIADAALKLVEMEKGKRPLRTPVDLMANGIDFEYNEATTEIKGRWLSQYGF